MKYTKKFMILMGIVMTMCFAGCGDEPKSNEDKTEVAETQKDKEEDNKDKEEDNKDKEEDNKDQEVKEDKNQEVKETRLENDYFSYVMPEGWTQSPVKLNDSSISILKGLNLGVDVTVLQVPQAGIDIQQYKDIIEQNLTAQPNCEILKLEIEESAVGEVVYLEVSSVVDKAMVQSMIDSGTIDQEAVDALGGIDVYAKGLSLQEAAMYYIYENNVLIVDGKCADKKDIEQISKIVKEIMNTIEVK